MKIDQHQQNGHDNIHTFKNGNQRKLNCVDFLMDNTTHFSLIRGQITHIFKQTMAIN